MRTLLKVEMDDLQATNELVLNGEIQSVFLEVSKLINPESSFFYSEQGYRSANFIFDLKDSSEMARISEIFFQRLRARVFFCPVMSAEELSRGLDMWFRDTGRIGGNDESFSLGPN